MAQGLFFKKPLAWQQTAVVNPLKQGLCVSDMCLRFGVMPLNVSLQTQERNTSNKLIEGLNFEDFVSLCEILV